MIDLLSDLIKNKKVLLLGFGREGKSTFNYINQNPVYKELAIADINEIKDDNIDLSNVKLITGKNYLDCIKDYDIVFKSPGVVLNKKVDTGSAIITSQVEQFIKHFKNQIIGITGTKGKSTVSSLIYHILKQNGFDVILAGNIGIPLFDIIKDINDNTIIVAELSCHQLENCKYSPKRAILLNIYEDHLDHYDDFDDYYNAKKNIYLHQDSSSILYCIEEVKPNISDLKQKINIIKKEILPFDSFDKIPNCKLIGQHNLLNCAFSYLVTKEFVDDDNKFINAVSTFETLPHRLEFIGNKEGIDYYDDSISTTVESTISAIESINNLETILIGGLDRGINYDKLVNYFNNSKIKNIICMYDSGHKIYNKLINIANKNIYYVDDLEKAVEKAKQITSINCSCVLSPASASYGYFKNFEERGDYYKKYIFDN